MQNSFLNHDNFIQHKPLADRMRPNTLDEFVGQSHILAKGRLLRRAIENDTLTSSIFYGPAGTGKTTIANIIAQTTSAHFVKLNAVSSGVGELRDVLKNAEDAIKFYNKPTYLFLDECHRWSKAQSDAILPAVEEGIIKLIGSTTENPSAAMTPAIVSRCRIYHFLQHTVEDVKKVILQALHHKTKGYGTLSVQLDDEALDYIATTSGGDIRQALSALEVAVSVAQKDSEPIIIDLALAKECVQTPTVGIDKQSYYDMISAMIKSMRGSDPNAALFWLAQLIHLGVDAKVIARRVFVHASEDVGLADPQVLLQAHAAAKAVEFVGMPEARIPLAQAVIAIATAPKSNTVVEAIDSALAQAQKGEKVEVPKHLCDHSYHIKGDVYGQYLYPHAYPHHVVHQNYLPQNAQNVTFYHPSTQGKEAQIAQRLEEWERILNSRA